MAVQIPALTPELIASGLAGFVLLGAIVRSVVKGYVDAKTGTGVGQPSNNSAAMMGALSIGFTKDQLELIVQNSTGIRQALEIQNQRLAEIAEAQGVMADKERHEMGDKLDRLDSRLTKIDRFDKLLSRIELAEEEQLRRQDSRPPRRT